MLALHRKPGEEIVLRDTKSGLITTIQLVRFGRGNAVIGITADDSVEIVRKELLTDKEALCPPQQKRAG